MIILSLTRLKLKYVYRTEPSNTQLVAINSSSLMESESDTVSTRADYLPFSEPEESRRANKGLINGSVFHEIVTRS